MAVRWRSTTLMTTSCSVSSIASVRRKHEKNRARTGPRPWVARRVAAAAARRAGRTSRHARDRRGHPVRHRAVARRLSVGVRAAHDGAAALLRQREQFRVQRARDPIRDPQVLDRQRAAARSGRRDHRLAASDVRQRGDRRRRGGHGQGAVFRAPGERRVARQAAISALEILCAAYHRQCARHRDHRAPHRILRQTHPDRLHDPQRKHDAGTGPAIGQERARRRRGQSPGVGRRDVSAERRRLFRRLAAAARPPGVGLHQFSGGAEERPGPNPDDDHRACHLRRRGAAFWRRRRAHPSQDVVTVCGPQGGPPGLPFGPEDMPETLSNRPHELVTHATRGRATTSRCTDVLLLLRTGSLHERGLAMQVMRRTVVALGAAAAILALVGCGGLGVYIGSGTSRSSAVVNKVGIQVQSGINIPTVVKNNTLLMIAIAYYSYGGQQYVSSTQGATWSTVHGSGAIGLFNGDCITPYVAGTVLQNICVFGATAGTATLNATVAGNTGTVTVTVL